MAVRKKTDSAQMSLLELSLKTAPCVPAIRQGLIESGRTEFYTIE